ncbi:DUF4450 domain-containing protein [Chitinophaga rhizophila]|uniref:DUF4450 domain-containing protein n=1 Tax=Chitinophaga rhizophila TaxID=2866212 RepID=A0ABS7GJF6_9BACT|nr:DUF4450 domain-containing protein [Chitinophaga rhizophila]MBW8686792.1 DUF4450 domain-containing protein [Chitinophaga rhizophila]
MNIRLTLSYLLLLPVLHGYSQVAPKQKAGDFIESTSYNDAKRNTPRTLHYRPAGDSIVCINGANRFTRALYGGHTAYRLETSDRPVFASFMPKNNRHIRFTIATPRHTAIALDSTSRCEASYSGGKRTYQLTDPSWGHGQLTITVLALHDTEGAIWKITTSNMPAGTQLWSGCSAIRAARLNRNGDMGADPPDSFEPASTPVYSSSCKWTIGPHATTHYMLIRQQEIASTDTPTGAALFNTAEKARTDLTARVRISTPDAFLNPVGGILSTAANGIWDGQTWLHGAIGWRMPLTGWRAAYAGDFLGWHDRARSHFDAFAASQVTNVPNSIPHPAQDTALHLARSAKIWGTPQYSNGYIARNPNRPDQMHHYDMNLVYIDALLWHLNWTGDTAYARKLWPVLTRHLAWEKLNYDPDNDGLFDAYACIWASDGLYYNAGAVTHSSAYNYRAFRMAAAIAEKIGEDPLPYQTEARKIHAAINARLWLKDQGHWAEYQDFMGLKRLHTSAGVYTIYHAIDSEAGDPRQNYQATRYIDSEIPHIPVRAAGLPDEGFHTISTSNWMPYVWSTNNVAFEEVMHTALSYFQAGRKEAGFLLLKSAVLDGMYLGGSPGNIGQVSFYDAARGECYRDFGDAIGVASRLFVQGLYGITPDALQGRLMIRPGFPANWPYASISLPDIAYSFRHSGTARQSSETDHYIITPNFSRIMDLELQLAARRDRISGVTVNGLPAKWNLTDAIAGAPFISIHISSKDFPQSKPCDIRITWTGDSIALPKGNGNRTRFERTSQGQLTWWKAIHYPSDKPAPVISPAFLAVNTASCEPVNMDEHWNASVTDIFNHQYLTPRPPYTTLQIPTQGIGEWCHPLINATIDDSGLRRQVRNSINSTNLGIPFRTPATGKNIVYTSLWDNYPDSVTIPLSGNATHAYLLMAGSTNQMQSRIENGYIDIAYTDGSRQQFPLINPDTWAPIEQDYYVDSLAFQLHAPRQYRLHLLSGLVSNDLGKALNIPGVYGRSIDGGAAVLQDIRLDPDKVLKHLTVRTLSNDVVIGLMSITLQRK